MSAPMARNTGPASRTRGQRRSSHPKAMNAAVYTARSTTRHPPDSASSRLDAKISAEMTSRKRAEVEQHVGLSPRGPLADGSGRCASRRSGGRSAGGSSPRLRSSPRRPVALGTGRVAGSGAGVAAGAAGVSGGCIGRRGSREIRRPLRGGLRLNRRGRGLLAGRGSRGRRRGFLDGRRLHCWRRSL